MWGLLWRVRGVLEFTEEGLECRGRKSFVGDGAGGDRYRRIQHPRMIVRMTDTTGRSNLEAP